MCSFHQWIHQYWLILVSEIRSWTIWGKANIRHEQFFGLPAWMRGRCHQTWNPPAPPRPVWHVCTATSEKLNWAKTLWVFPFSAELLSSEECVVALPRPVRLQGSGFPPQSHRTCFICLFFRSSTLRQQVTVLSEVLLCSFSQPQTLLQPTC